MFYAFDVSLVKRSLSEKRAKKTSDKRTCVPRFDLVSNDKTSAQCTGNLTFTIHPRKVGSQVTLRPSVPWGNQFEMSRLQPSRIHTVCNIYLCMFNPFLAMVNMVLVFVTVHVSVFYLIFKVEG